MNYTEKDLEIYGWAKGVMRFWFTILQLVRFVIVSVTNLILVGVEQTIALLAPIPNAISLYNIAKLHWGMGHWQALAFSVLVEVIGYFMIHASLLLLGGYLTHGVRWRVVFWLIAVTTVIALATVVVLVYVVEVTAGGYTVLSLLPVFSMAAFVGLGALAWHRSQPEILAIIDETETAERKQQRDKLRAELEDEVILEQHRNRLELEQAKQAKALAKYTQPVQAKTTLQTTLQTTAFVPQTTAFQTAFTPELTAIGGGAQDSEIIHWVSLNPGAKVLAATKAFGVSKTYMAKLLHRLAEEGKIVETQDGQAYRYRVTDSYNQEAG